MIKDALLEAGVINLKEFGYPSVTVESICTDPIYREFFKQMLEEAKGRDDTADKVIDELINECETS